MFRYHQFSSFCKPKRVLIFLLVIVLGANISWFMKSTGLQEVVVKIENAENVIESDKPDINNTWILAKMIDSLDSGLVENSSSSTTRPKSSLETLQNNSADNNKDKEIKQNVQVDKQHLRHLQVDKHNLQVDKQHLQNDKQHLQVEKQHLQVEKQHLQVDKHNLQVDKQHLQNDKQNVQVDKKHLQGDITRSPNLTDTSTQAVQLQDSYNRSGFTVMANPALANKVLVKSTMWTELKCIRPRCKLQDLSLVQKDMAQYWSMEHNIAKVCPTPNSTFVLPDNSTIDLVKLEPTINCDLGGRWHPSGCKPKQKVALLVPYRNRATMLGTWLRHIHWFLQQQKLGYAIYIVEQDDEAPFNRAILLNIAAKFAMANDDYDCLINHDIDQLPMNLQNSYTCDEDTKRVTHYARNVSCRPEEPYVYHFGMVSSLTPAQFLSVNGYSNLYFGWGAEDDDMSTRLINQGYTINLRKKVGAYMCLSHEPQNKENDRDKYIGNAAKRNRIEGFNTMSYDVLAYSETPLFTWIYVHVDKDKVRTSYDKVKPVEQKTIRYNNPPRKHYSYNRIKTVRKLQKVQVGNNLRKQ